MSGTKKRPDVGSRIGVFDGTPAPKPDTSWPVAGEIPPKQGGKS